MDALSNEVSPVGQDGETLRVATLQWECSKLLKMAMDSQELPS